MKDCDYLTIDDLYSLEGGVSVVVVVVEVVEVVVVLGVSESSHRSQLFLHELLIYPEHL